MGNRPKNQQQNRRQNRGAPLYSAVLGLLLALGGCGISTTGEQSMFVLGCVPERFELLEQADWDGASRISMNILEDRYRPMVFHFTKGKAYELEVTNLDHRANNIWAPGFLKEGVAIHSIQIGEQQPATGCINGIRLKPKSSLKIRFVAANEGRYEIFNTAFAIVPGQIADGVFHVDPARPATPEN